MDRFSRFVASIDTPGGMVLVCIVLILMGAAFSKLGIGKGEELITLSAGALFAAMRGKGAANHDTYAPRAGPLLPPVTHG